MQPFFSLSLSLLMHQLLFNIKHTLYSNLKEDRAKILVVTYTMVIGLTTP